MRVLLISRCPPFPLHLGDRLIVHHVARELAARGHQIDLLAFYDRDSDLTDILQYRALFNDVQLIRESPRRAVSYAQRLLLPGHMFPTRCEDSWSPEMWRAIEARVQGASYELVHLFGGIQVYEFRALVEKLPTLIVSYESYALFLERALLQAPNLAAKLKVSLQLEAARRFEAGMFKGYGRVVVLTEKDADALRRLDASLPLVVIPNGIDLDFFTPDPTLAPDSTPNIVFVGNYEYSPNAEGAHWLATEIFPQVQRRIAGVQLYLVGNAPPPTLTALNSGPIHVTGRVPDVRPYLQRASAFVSPLRVGAGIKNKILEAMAMGAPIVATPLSADGIGLREGEHILFGESADQLAEAIVRLLGNLHLSNAMRAANRALIEARFTWKTVADQYEDLYQGLYE